MADYAGANAALKQRITDNWGDTPVGFLNESAPQTSVDDGNGNVTSIPWTLFEIVSTGSSIIGTGTPGNQTIVYDGLIRCHVFVPSATGTESGIANALALGEIFRNKVLYNEVTAGCYVRTWTPRIDDGNEASEDGLWFRVTATIPFEYWHRG